MIFTARNYSTEMWPIGRRSKHAEEGQTGGRGRNRHKRATRAPKGPPSLAQRFIAGSTIEIEIKSRRDDRASVTG
jgi:hypothetical protein